MSTESFSVFNEMSRSAALVRASFITDAATMPVHWIYNQTELAALVQQRSPAFFSPPSCPFYKYPGGVFSPYGDESIPLLRSMSLLGEFNTEKSAEAMHSFFTSYPDEMVHGYAGRLNHAPKAFSEARNEGKSWDECSQDDTQANGIAKVPLIVARYAGSPEMPSKIEAMVKILQNTEISAVSSHLYSRILEKVLLSDCHPRDAMNSLLGNTDLSSYAQNLLSFTTNDVQIAEWVHFSDDVDAITLLEGESPYHKMTVKGNVLVKYIESGASLAQTLLFVGTEGDNALLDRLICTEHPPVESGADPLSGLSVNKVLTAIGLSCNLPG